MMRQRTVRVVAAAIVVLVSIALVLTALPADAAARHGVEQRDRRADRIALPAGFQPEGIETGPGQQAWVGSRATGDIYRFDLRTGRGKVITQGPGTPSLGLKLDGKGRLFVAGGTGGDLRVVDARSGRVLASYRLSNDTSFVNDIVITGRDVWVTDSAQARLYRLPLGRHGELPAQSQVRTVPLTGDWQQVTGNNANGITTSPDGRALLVVNSTVGALYRVTTDGRASRVDLGGYAVTNGDGLLREGRQLFVVQNRDNRIAVLDLDRTGTQGRLSRTIASPLFDVPSTVARSGGYLYLPNARFTTTPTPTTPYDVTRVRG